MCQEILIPTPAIRALIRDDKLHQVYSMMQTGQAETGMQTMNQALMNMIKGGRLAREEALHYSPVPEELEKMILAAGKFNR